MSRADRSGKRKPRSHQSNMRIPEMGYYLIVTDTEGTESSYFNGLRSMLPDEIKEKLVIKVVETRTQDLIQTCKEECAYQAQYRIPWIVFDRDQIMDFDKIIASAEYERINVGWSNPCFEIWMFTYFGKMPAITESWKCCEQFSDVFQKRASKKYSKSDPNLYKILCRNGDEAEALKIAERRYLQHIRDGNITPSEMCPCSTVFQLVGEIRRKISLQDD